MKDIYEMDDRTTFEIGVEGLIKGEFYFVVKASGHNCVELGYGDQIPREYGGELIDLSSCRIEVMERRNITLNGSHIRGALLVRVIFMRKFNERADGSQIIKQYIYIRSDLSGTFWHISKKYLRNLDKRQRRRKCD